MGKCSKSDNTLRYAGYIFNIAGYLLKTKITFLRDLEFTKTKAFRMSAMRDLNPFDSAIIRP